MAVVKSKYVVAVNAHMYYYCGASGAVSVCLCGWNNGFGIWYNTNVLVVMSICDTCWKIE